MAERERRSRWSSSATNNPGNTVNGEVARLDEALRNAVSQPLSMMIDGKKVTMTRGEAIVHRLVAEALRGDHRAIKVWCHMRDHGTASETAMTDEDRVPELDRDAEPLPVTDEHRARAVALLLSRVMPHEGRRCRGRRRRWLPL